MNWSGTRYLRDIVAFTDDETPRVQVQRDVVFAGYGINAPELRWNDYAGVNVKGKWVMIMVNDPPAPADEPALFGGSALTYYGRWTYKYELGAKLGVAAVLIVHETEPAGYPFVVVQGKTEEQFELETKDGNAGRAAVEGWITLEQAKSLFTMAGRTGAP